MHIGYVPRERPPFSALNFRSGAYHFHKLPQKIRSGASPFYIFWRICRSGDNHFQISLISTRSSPPTAGSARTQSVRQRRGLAAVPEIRIFTLKTAQARSGAPHFQARNGSTGSSFRSPCPFCTLPRHIPTKIWGEYPPPPGGGFTSCKPVTDCTAFALRHIRITA